MVKPARKTRHHHAFNTIETLEPRTMLSATADLSRNGTLFLRGTPGNDYILVQQVGSNLTLKGSGLSKSIPLNQVREIRAELGGGADILDVARVQARGMAIRALMGTGISEKVSISDSSFASISIDADAAGGTVVDIARTQSPSISFNAGNDGWRDVLKLSNNSQIGTVTATLGHGNDTISVSGSTIQTAKFDFGGGKDSLYMTGSQTSNLSVDLGTGMNEVAELTGSAFGTVTLNAAASINTTAKVSQCPTTSQLVASFGNGNDTLTLESSKIPTVDARMSGGDDTINIRNHHGTTLKANMGAGRDKVFINPGSSLTVASVDMGTGNNETVEVKNAALTNFIIESTAARGVTVSLLSAHIEGSFVLRCGNDTGTDTLKTTGGTKINRLVANMGGGNDHVSIGGTSRVKKANIKMGSGNDLFFCYYGVSISGTVNGGGGIDRFQAPGTIKLVGFERRAGR